ncbi:hypothetical protein FQN50_009977 [Emmonsiellopsis sp. PD_5]|nr:hypothetical protein FQN50_009977 [Emmonsiellopsis sp. PD_5]
MASCILLDYLTQPNPSLVNTHSLTGLPTKQDLPHEIEVVEWEEFNLENLMNCYGHVLRMEFQLPDISPPPTNLERNIVDEDSLDHLISRSVIPIVNAALGVAWHCCYPNHQEALIQITRGGRARRPEDDAVMQDGNSPEGTDGNAKIFPDWAGAIIRKDDPWTCVNRCPGDTKLSTKWKSDKKVKSWEWPLAQMLIYCGENWNCRYGYLITQKELVVLRFARE